MRDALLVAFLTTPIQRVLRVAGPPAFGTSFGHDAALLEHIRETHEQSYGTYGAASKPSWRPSPSMSGASGSPD